MAFSLPLPTHPPSTGVWAEASAEGLISRSLFMIEKNAWLFPNGPSSPPARPPLSGWLLRRGQRADASGNQAVAGLDRRPWDLKRARGVLWDLEGPRRPENGSFSSGVLWEPPTGEASISLSSVFCPPTPLWIAAVSRVL